MRVVMGDSGQVEAYHITPNEFDRFTKQMRDQISSEISSIKGLVVEEPMTTKQAAKFLQVHPNTLYILINNGLPCHQMGGSNYFFPSELAAYIKSKKR